MAAHVIRWASQTEIKTVNWLWKPFIPYGKVTIVEGDGGEGKTTMILAVAAMLSRGIQPPSLVNRHLEEEQAVEPITIFMRPTRMKSPIPQSLVFFGTAVICLVLRIVGNWSIISQSMKPR